MVATCWDWDWVTYVMLYAEVEDAFLGVCVVAAVALGGGIRGCTCCAGLLCCGEVVG